MHDTVPRAPSGHLIERAGGDTCSGHPGSPTRWCRSPASAGRAPLFQRRRRQPSRGRVRHRACPWSRPKTGPGGTTPGRSSALSAETRGPDRPERRAARFVTTSRPFWRIRLAREMPRYLLSAAAACGLLASARFAIAPPSPAAPSAVRAPEPQDRAAEGYAVLFARRYLTWEAAGRRRESRRCRRSLAPESDPRPARCSQRQASSGSNGAEVVQVRIRPGTRVYTVAAQTDTDGLIYLTAGVVRAAGGASTRRLSRIRGCSLIAARFPTPGGARTGRTRPGHGRDPRGSQLPRRLRRRARCRFASQAHVSLPTDQLTLDSVEHMSWAKWADGHAVVQAHDERGVSTCSLTNWMSPGSRAAARWLRSTDPDA